MTPSKAKRVMMGCLAGAVIAGLLARVLSWSDPNSAVSMVFVLLMLGLAVGWIGTGVLFWRCPYCGSGLPVRTLHISCCPHCGKDLGMEE